jgi:hypothetical protein
MRFDQAVHQICLTQLLVESSFRLVGVYQMQKQISLHTQFFLTVLGEVVWMGLDVRKQVAKS